MEIIISLKGILRYLALWVWILAAIALVRGGQDLFLGVVLYVLALGYVLSAIGSTILIFAKRGGDEDAPDA